MGKPEKRMRPLPEAIAAGLRWNEQTTATAAIALLQQMESKKNTPGLHWAPQDVLVGEDTLVLAKKAGEPKGARLYRGYSAPEESRGLYIEASMVYFAGAVLYSLHTGQVPEDMSVRQSEARPVLTANGTLDTIIRKAMELDPEKRIASLWRLQEVLKEALPYMTAAPEETRIPAGMKKKRRRPVLVAVSIVLAVAILLGGGFGGFTWWQSDKVQQAADAGAYAEVIERLDGTPWLQEGYDQEYRYSQAMLAWQSGEREQSLALLQGLPGFRNADEDQKAIRYEIMETHLQAYELEECKAILEGLGEYRDGKQILQQIEDYQEAEKEPHLPTQYQQYVDLGVFLDSAEKAQEIQDEMLSSAMIDYNTRNFGSALEFFMVLEKSNVEDAGYYRQACQLYVDSAAEYNRENANPSAQRDAALFNRMEELSQHIDVGPLVFSGWWLMEVFLDGTWVGGKLQRSWVSAQPGGAVLQLFSLLSLSRFVQGWNLSLQ